MHHIITWKRMAFLRIILYLLAIGLEFFNPVTLH